MRAKGPGIMTRNAPAVSALLRVIADNVAAIGRAAHVILESDMRTETVIAPIRSENRLMVELQEELVEIIKKEKYENLEVASIVGVLQFLIFNHIYCC